MTRDEVKSIRAVLQRIKDPDGYVNKAIAICDKQIAIFDQYKGQIKENYDYDRMPF